MSRPACDVDALAVLLRAGDVVALDALTRCFGERMLAAARRRCRADDAEDAVQDALLGAVRAGPGFRGDGPLEGWLVRLVATACSRMRRGRKNDPALHERDVELAAEDDAGRAELAGVLGEALLELAPQDRAILIMADGLGMKGPEIAAAVGLSAGAVRTRLSRSHARLRTRLEAFRPA